MNIEPYLDKINEIECPSEPEQRKAFIDNLKKADSEAFDYLKELNLAPYEKGKGLAISEALTRVKTAVLLKCLQYCGPVPEYLAFVAVGGYGREEMSPFSDIDILVLQKKEKEGDDYINKFFYLLWDMNYKLGNSVRTIRNAAEHAAEDITFLTSVFDTRLIVGDESLFLEMHRSLKRVLESTRTRYAQAQIELIRKIFNDRGSIILLKEPNLKENPGGLRSLHLAEWINYSFAGGSGLDGIKHFLPEKLYHQVYAAYDYLMYVRNMLHFMVNRKEDFLYIDYHLKVADYLQYRGNELKRVRQLMTQVHNKLTTVFLISFYVVDELFNRNFRKGYKKLGNDFYVQNNELFVNDDVKPSVESGMEAAFLFARNGFNLSYNLIRFMKNCGRMVKPEHLKSKEIFYLFIPILSLDNSFDALNLMKLSDYLYKYLKPFAQIRHLMIYNPFHRYTVDEHSLESIRSLENLLSERFNLYEREKVKELIELARKHKNSLWILKLALIFHDIGKAIPGDHSKNGAEIAHRFFTEMPILYRYRDLVEFLIENHLILSHISRRSDIQNYEVMSDFARKFMLSPYPLEYLEYLYLITYADVHATNPTNYTGYTASLLHQVYRRTAMMLTGKIDRDYEARTFEEKIGHIREIVNNPEIELFIRCLGSNYANYCGEDEIIADYTVLKGLQGDEARVEVRSFNEYLKVKFYAPDRLGLFAAFTGLLLVNGADIVKSNVFTYCAQNRTPIAFDVFYVTQIFGSNLSDGSMRTELQAWIERLESSFHKYLTNDQGLEERVQNQRKRMKNIPSIFHRSADVSLCRKSETQYQITLSGNDRPSLLYDISRFLSIRGLWIETALIDTVGWHIRDSFTVKSESALSDNELEKLRIDLKEIAESDVKP